MISILMYCHLKDDVVKKIGEYTIVKNSPFFTDSNIFCKEEISHHIKMELKLLDICVYSCGTISSIYLIYELQQLLNYFFT